MKPKKETNFFDNPRNIKKLWITLYFICGLILVLDIFAKREPHFGIDHYFGFYAFLGFVGCAALILVAKLVGFILKKSEDYYD